MAPVAGRPYMSMHPVAGASRQLPSKRRSSNDKGVTTAGMMPRYSSSTGPSPGYFMVLAILLSQTNARIGLPDAPAIQKRTAASIRFFFKQKCG